MRAVHADQDAQSLQRWRVRADFSQKYKHWLRLDYSVPRSVARVALIPIDLRCSWLCLNDTRAYGLLIKMSLYKPLAE